MNKGNAMKQYEQNFVNDEIARIHAPSVMGEMECCVAEEIADWNRTQPNVMSIENLTNAFWHNKL